MSRTKKRCGHFRSHWTVVRDAQGTWSIRYCDACREAIETRQGAAIASHHQRAVTFALRGVATGEEPRE